MLQSVPTCPIQLYEQDAAVSEISNHMLDVKIFWLEIEILRACITLKPVLYRSKSFDSEFKISILSTLYELCKQTMRIW